MLLAVEPFLQPFDTNYVRVYLTKFYKLTGTLTTEDWLLQVSLQNFIRFSSQHSRSGLQLSGTPVPGT